MIRINCIFVFCIVCSVFFIHPQSKQDAATKDYIEKLWGDNSIPHVVNGFIAGVYSPIHNSVETVISSVDYAYTGIHDNFIEVRDAIAKLPKAQRIGVAAGAYAMTALTWYFVQAFYGIHKKTAQWPPKGRTFVALITLLPLIPFAHSLLASASATASLSFWNRRGDKDKS